jgi:hypothetical protein
MDRLRILSSFVALMVVVSWVAPMHAEPSPKWTDTSGKFSIVAEFVQVDGDIVVLRKADGQEVRVPMTKLSSPSRVQARKAAKAMGASDASSGSSETGAILDSPSVPFPEGMTCEQTVRYLADQSAIGNYRVLLDSLPAKFQADVSEVLRLAGKQIDPKLFSEVESTANRLVQTLKSKKSFVLGSPMIVQYSDKKFIPVYDAGVNVIAAVLATKIINPKNMQSADYNAMIEAYLKGLVPAGEKLSTALEEAGFPPLAVDNKMVKFNGSRLSSELKEMKFTVEAISESEAKVAVETNAKNNEEFKQEWYSWYRIDGRWVAGSEESWVRGIEQMKDALNTLSPEVQTKATEQLKNFNMQFLSKFEAIKSQQELDAMILPMMMMAGPMMQQMGGGGMPGGGMPPPAFGPDPNLPIEQ